jgi:hypothetical protein
MRGPAGFAPPGLAEGGPLKSRAFRCLVIAAVALLPITAAAQRTIADYQRATSLRDRYQSLAYGVTDQVRWVYETAKVVYRKTVRGGFDS